MLYTICIALILIASVLIILAVLVQNPKSGMAANFGASNQVMGVRETSDFLEKFTWTMAIAIVVLSLVATLAMDKGLVAESNSEISKDVKALQERYRVGNSCHDAAGRDSRRRSSRRAVGRIGAGFQPDSAGREERGSRPMRVLSDILQAVDFPRLFVFPVFGRTSCAEVLSGAGQSLESKIGYYDNGKWNKVF